MKMPWEEAGITEEEYLNATEEEYMNQLEKIKDYYRIIRGSDFPDTPQGAVGYVAKNNQLIEWLFTEDDFEEAKFYYDIEEIEGDPK